MTSSPTATRNVSPKSSDLIAPYFFGLAKAYPKCFPKASKANRSLVDCCVGDESYPSPPILVGQLIAEEDFHWTRDLVSITNETNGGALAMRSAGVLRIQDPVAPVERVGWCGLVGYN